MEYYIDLTDCKYEYILTCHIYSIHYKKKLSKKFMAYYISQFHTHN